MAGRREIFGGQNLYVLVMNWIWGAGQKEGSWTPRFPFEQLVMGWGGGGMGVGMVGAEG